MPAIPLQLLSPQTRAQLRPYWALSRTPHAVVDMATPALAALLCLGGFPSFGVVILGLITVFAGYTSVYALNDLVDYRTDQRKMVDGLYSDSEAYLDGVLPRHPMAQGLLSFQQGLIWTLAWGVIALGGAYLLNPVCVVIFLAGCLLEALYCWLWQMTPYRAVVNGLVKTSGAIAAVFAVQPHPSALFLVVLFVWIFFWEIGGQNIPADWSDISEDRRFGARTIPVHFGPRRASVLAVLSLLAAFLFSVVLLLVSPLTLWAPLWLAVLLVNAYCLLLPVVRVLDTQRREDAMQLFNKASHYPLALLAIVLVGLLFS
ncbi:MAG: UbiA family prenyltransferase [Desulfosarcinaceae bacterium]|nr:UbiA family prenyltransferase [Desulfosarcinaceae bacterium]